MRRTFDARQKPASVSRSYPFFVATTIGALVLNVRNHASPFSLARTKLTLSSLVDEQQEHRGNSRSTLLNSRSTNQRQYVVVSTLRVRVVSCFMDPSCR